MSGGRIRAVLLLLTALGCARAVAPPAPDAPGFHPDHRADPPPEVALQPVPAPPPPPGRLPDVPPASGPLRLDVVYPPAGALIGASDSSFLLGSVGHGAASLRINGQPVRVWPNGAWLAWIPLPPGPSIEFRLEAILGGDTVRLSHPARTPAGFAEPAMGPWIDTTSFQPAGTVWWPRDEYLPLSVRAAPAARLSLVLPGGERVALARAPSRPEVSPGARAFDRDTMNLHRPWRLDRHQVSVRGRAFGADPGGMLPGVAAGPGASPLVVEAVLGRDTVRARWPIRLALLDTLPLEVEIDDDLAGTGGTDGSSPARSRPGATYHWFLPTGTRVIATGRQNGDLRVRLSPGQEAWVAAGEARPAATGGAAAAVVGSLTVTPQRDWFQVRIPVSRQVPFFVEEGERRLVLTLYHAAGDINWIRYGAGPDPLLDALQWRQAGSDVELVVELAQPVWGYRTRWDQGDLLLEVRRPPVIAAESPMRGLRIAVDPGHPPGGSTGPTRLTEAEANLAVALRVAELLEGAGARVLLTRRDAGPVDLWPRVRMAEAEQADLLVSIHNNALPDGVNPFTNNGTSVFHYHPRSIPFARLVQAALVRRTGLPDLGVARGDLALIRSTWMPAILTEGMFMIVPEQEAALRSLEGQERYAAAVFEGIRDFLLWRSGVARTSPR